MGMKYASSRKATPTATRRLHYVSDELRHASSFWADFCGQLCSDQVEQSSSPLRGRDWSLAEPFGNCHEMLVVCKLSRFAFCRWCGSPFLR